MTWLDVALIVVWIIFVAIGARMGSLWVAGCLIGGFIGAFLADYYSLPLAAMIGGFNGAPIIASILLFSSGIVIGLLPAWLFSKLTAALLIGLLNSIFGLIAGALTGLLVVSLLLLWTVQRYPDVEKFRAWRDSRAAKPLYDLIEDYFNHHEFRSMSFTKKIKQEARGRLEPLADEATQKVKDLSSDAIDRLKK
jgi:uncharacterized membrane protein required for colicin V production